MEHFKNNNQSTTMWQQQNPHQHVTTVTVSAVGGNSNCATPTPTELPQSAHFEYAPPTPDPATDYDDISSSKSTPFYTPLEYFQDTFEFPSPTKIEHMQDIAELHGHISASLEQSNMPMQRKTPTPSLASTSRSFAGARQQLSSSTSPVVSRKPRRFSLYERRSCSPQQLLIKNAASVSIDSSAECVSTMADKENTKPFYRSGVTDKRDSYIRSNSGNNSPIALMGPDTGSPKILDINMSGSSNSGARLPCSPKLLASLNNLNLTGSPLGVISSAGYKNGNYFKFPEIDQLVHEQSTLDDPPENTIASVCDNQQIRSSRHRSNTSGKDRQKSVGNNSKSLDNARPDEYTVTEFSKTNPIAAVTKKVDCKKNRKNKNNLTINITDVPKSTFELSVASPISPSSLAKPKTPTIKSTKEKSLSLDSAARDSELTVIVSSSRRNNSHSSCDEIDAQALRRRCLPVQQFIPCSVSGACFERVAGERGLRFSSPATTNRSTSLSQLALHGDGCIAVTHEQLQTQTLDPSNTATSFKAPVNATTFQRATRRRWLGGSGGSSVNSNAPAEWLTAYNRSRNPVETTGLGTEDAEVLEKSLVDVDTAVVLQEETDDDAPAESDNALLCTSYAPSVTTTSALASHRGIQKHTSNTNLKTLPEFLTLVEFSTAGGLSGTHQPYKQKSMELPGVAVRAKSVASASSTNLLQRRGSNHSLTLNLHGSCSNLLRNCRSGLSVSNYSLGSAVGNSTIKMNSKSSCNLDLSGASIVNRPSSQADVSQGTKQSLFRRRGSNQSLTLTNVATASCGNLNSFTSQHSRNKVARTSSFITATKNTANSVTQKRGLLERRGSNQNLTLNMASSLSGISGLDIERHMHASSSLYLGETCAEEADMSVKPPTPHRRFFSSESLNRGAAPFADLNQAHRRNAKQVCFGSVSDLKPSASILLESSNGASNGSVQTLGEVRRDSFNFQDSTVCSCTGVRNIMTRPLSPQSTSEEFKIYLANIQMLQNASNALTQLDLIKLNYIFDNSYASNNKGLAEQAVPMLSVRSSKEVETPPGIRVTNSEDCEVAERYLAAVRSMLVSVQPNEDEQKRIFCELHKEFWDLPLNHQEKPMVFGSQAKNRYKTILPNENSRVLLEKEAKQLAELAEVIRDAHAQLAEHISRQLNISDEVPYINANYIKGPDYTSTCYVATQGPLPNTIFEFWLMVYQNSRRYFQTTDRKAKTVQYYQKVIMLTNFMENNRQKCAVYFPVELNEIFIATSGQEVVAPTAAALDFFKVYLQPNDNTPPPFHLFDGGAKSGPPVGIEHYRAEVSAELQPLLPPLHGNYFVIKNIGIVRKNGFSIRKLVILYCINIGLSMELDNNGAAGTTQLLINRFYSYHYWYPDWPDHRSPRDINTLLDICLHILNFGKCESEFETFEVGNDGDSLPSKQEVMPTPTQAVELYQHDIFNATQPLPVIHCSAGIGRTGCLTATLNAVRQLRQSFAYSLTSMAAEVCKEREKYGGAGGDLTAQALLSPVDFALPAHYVTEAQRLLVSQIGMKDTDSSFTRNTLYYINYILRRQQKEETGAANEYANSSDTEADSESGTDDKTDINASDEAILEVALVEAQPQHWSLPVLNELPKMPDIFVDVLGIVCNLRLQRGGMVQNSEQYELIHRAICLYLKRIFALKRF